MGRWYEREYFIVLNGNWYSVGYWGNDDEVLSFGLWKSPEEAESLLEVKCN